MAWTLLLFFAEADTLAQYVESVTFTTHISAFTIMHNTETIQRMGAAKPPESQNHQQGLCLPHATLLGAQYLNTPVSYIVGNRSLMSS